MKYTLVLLAGLMAFPISASSIEYHWQNAKGEEVSLEKFKDKSVILHFWASWCPPCRTEMPAMDKWVKAHPNVNVVMISMDSSQEYAAEFYADKGIQAPLNMGDMGMTSRLGVRGLPTTIVIGADGEVKKRHLGDIDWSDKQKVQELLVWK